MRNKRNSKLLTKSINWAIGDLGRKKSYHVTIRDTVLGKPTNVNVISKEMPQAPDLEFSKIDTNFYSASHFPQEIGYKEILVVIGKLYILLLPRHLVAIAIT